jgi:hypothetical protein
LKHFENSDDKDAPALFFRVFLRSLHCTKREAKKYNLKTYEKHLSFGCFVRERERERELLKFRVITSMGVLGSNK